MTGAYEPLHLDWPDCRNVRDLGGMPAGDGARIRYGALIRSDSLVNLFDDAVEDVRAAGVSRIVDLRRFGESPKVHPFVGDWIYLSVPVQDPADPDYEWLPLAESYLAMLDLRPQLFTNAVSAVADAPAGAVVVHCAGGKDRTGIVVALALTVAGVAPEFIAADYALTEGRLEEASNAVLKTVADERTRKILRGLQATPGSNMLRVLEYLDEKYDGVEGYLRAAGMSSEQLAALRDRLLDVTNPLAEHGRSAAEVHR
jgi:protein-tyrosine phosphatase